MPYFDIFLDDASIKDKVTSFDVSHARGEYTKNVLIELADYSVYSLLDFARIRKDESLVIVTAQDGDLRTDGYVTDPTIFASVGYNFTTGDVVAGDYLYIVSGADEGTYKITSVGADGLTCGSKVFSIGTSISFVPLRYLGKFFVEDINVLRSLGGTTIPSLWGRSTTARLGPPYSKKLTKSWRQLTNFYNVVQEIIEGAGFIYAEANIAVSDFPIHKDTLVVVQQYPIDVLQQLAAVTNGYVSTDRHGTVHIKKYTFHPGAADVALTDADLAPGWSTSIKYSDFGNRIKVSTASSRNKIGLCFFTSVDCAPADGVTKVNLALVSRTEKGAAGPSGSKVSWSLDDDTKGTLDANTTYTQEARIADEIVRATDNLTVVPRYPPIEVIGVWAESDKKHEKINFFKDSVGGRTGSVNDKGQIKLSAPLFFCDQKVRVTYTTGGIASNKFQVGTMAGKVSIYADMLGVSAKYELPIGLGCSCPYDVDMELESEQVAVNEATQVLVCASRGGNPVPEGFRVVFGSRAKLGSFGKATGRLADKTKITGEETVVFHENGQSKVALRHPVKSVSSAKMTLTDAPLSVTAFSANILTVRRAGDKLAPLNARVTVTYTAKGCARATYTAGSTPGRDYLVANIKDGTEKGQEVWQAIDIGTIGEPNDATSRDQFPNSAPYPDSTPRPMVTPEQDSCEGANTVQGGILDSLGRPLKGNEDVVDSERQRPRLSMRGGTFKSALSDCKEWCKNTVDPTKCAFYCMDCESACAAYSPDNTDGGFDTSTTGPYKNYFECMHDCEYWWASAGYGLSCSEAAELEFIYGDRALGADYEEADGETALFRTCTEVAEAAGLKGSTAYIDAYSACKDASEDRGFGRCWQYKCQKLKGKKGREVPDGYEASCADRGGYTGMSVSFVGPANDAGTNYFTVIRGYCADGTMVETVSVTAAPKCPLSDNISKISAWGMVHDPEDNLQTAPGCVPVYYPADSELSADPPCPGSNQAYFYCLGVTTPEQMAKDLSTHCPAEI